MTNLRTETKFLFIAGQTNILRTTREQEGYETVPQPIVLTKAKDLLPTVKSGMMLVLKVDCRLLVVISKEIFDVKPQITSSGVLF